MRAAPTAIAAIAAASLLAACGSSSGGSGSSTGAAASKPATTHTSGPGGSGYAPYGGGSSSSSSTASSGGAAAEESVSVRHGSLGAFLVDAKGRAIYLFLKDKTTKSTCYGACAAVWPPVTGQGTPHAGAGVKQSLLGTTKRKDGTTELTYGGHPLYLYAGDSNPGDTKGEGLNQFGAKWYLVRPSGSKLDND